MTNPSLREALEAVLLVYPDLPTAKEIAAARSEAIRALAAPLEHEEGGCRDDGCLCWRQGRESESRPVWSAP